jgi:predicted naringenin-chalcone synthase
MSFVIRGLGTAHPPDALSPNDGLGIARRLAGPDVRMSTWLGPVYTNSGIVRRFQVLGGAVAQDVVNRTNLTDSPYLPTKVNDGVGPTTAQRLEIYNQEAPKLACQAAVRAISESKLPVGAITHLVTVSCTGFSAPGIDLALINGLGLSSTVQRTHIGFMGCHGAINGLRVARAFTSSDPDACVLLCAVELCSLHYYYGSAADRLIANAIFADGAAAVVGTGVGRWSTPSVDQSQDDSLTWKVLASGSGLIPDSQGDMTWTIGDHGFEMTLSRRVPSQIARHLRSWLEAWLVDQGLSLSSIRSWAVHPGGPRILDAVMESLALPSDALSASRWVFAHYGNMSSPTVLFVLDRLRQTHAPRPCLALGFGPGLVAEVALLG